MPGRSRLASSVAVLAVAGALGTAGAPAQTGRGAATPKITGKGVGKVRIGMLFSRARTLGLVGRAGPACELDPGSRAATLTSPLKGSVALTKVAPRRISRISVRNGAAARGVEVGDPLSAVKTAYPSAKVD